MSSCTPFHCLDESPHGVSPAAHQSPRWFLFCMQVRGLGDTAVGHSERMPCYRSALLLEQSKLKGVVCVFADYCVFDPICVLHR